MACPKHSRFFAALEKQEHERSRGAASPVFVACGRRAGDIDQNNTVWAGVRFHRTRGVSQKQVSRLCSPDL